MLIKLGLHMLPQQLAATTPTKPRKKRNNATSQASRKSKRVRVGASTNHDEEGRVEPQLRDSPEKEAKRDEARVVFDDERESNGATKPNDRLNELHLRKCY
jgi:DNA replication initiation complex subunit (GINS family)